MSIYESTLNAVKGMFGGKDNTIKKEDQGDDLVVKLENLFKEAKRSKKSLLKVIDDNKKQYLGKHWQNVKRPSYKSDIVMNLQYTAVETITPIMTDRQPRLLVHKKREAPHESEKLANITEEMINYHWERLKMPLRSPEIVRNMLTYRDCILYPYWNFYEDDVDVDIVNPKYIYFDPKATKVEDLEYFILATPRSIKYIKETYENVTDEMLEGSTPGVDEMDSDKDKKDRQNMVLLKEFWGYVESDGDYKIKKISWIGNTILKNEVDPNWDYEGEVNEVKTTEEESEETGIEEDTEMQEERKQYNHFSRPKLPIIIIPTFKFAESLLSETSQIEQTAKLQYAINKRKAQIEDNANMMANPIWLVAKDSGIDTNDLSNIPNSIIEGVDISPDKIRRESGTSLPSFVFNDMEQSQRAFDNIWGTHDISKGGKINVKSATEAQLLKEADQGRIALLIRNFERGIENLGNWWLQLMKKNYTETHYGRVIVKGKVEEFIQMTRDEIPDNIEIMVKAGSTMPVDRVQRRQEAIEMFNSGAIDPITFFEKLEDVEDPEEKAQMLDAWRKGVLFPDIKSPEQQQQEQMQGEELPPTLDEGNPEEELPPEL